MSTTAYRLSSSSSLCSVAHWDKGASINAGLDLYQFGFLVTNMYFPEKQKAAIVACVPDMWVNIVQSNYLFGFLAGTWSMSGKKILPLSKAFLCFSLNVCFLK